MPPRPKAKAKARARRSAPIKKPSGRSPPRRQVARPGREAEWTLTKDIRLETLAPRDKFLVKGMYYQEEAVVAGTLREISVTEKGQYLVIALEGTQSEELMKWSSMMTAGGCEALLWVHICLNSCKKDCVQDNLLHMTGLQGLKIVEDWMSNCMPVQGGVGDLDELGALRESMKDLPSADGLGDDTLPPANDLNPRLRTERKENEESARKKRKGKEKRNSERPSKAVGKTMEPLFKGTGLDKNVRVSKYVKKGKRRKQRSESTHSDKSTSSSSQPSETGVLIFGEEDRIRKLARTCLGGLTKMAVREVRRLLLVSTGEAEEQGDVSPLFVRYWRQNLRQRVSPVLNRESLTVAYALDELLRGRVASAADVLCQRLKSLESLSSGEHWSTCQKLEVVPDEGASLVGRGGQNSQPREQGGVLNKVDGFLALRENGLPECHWQGRLVERKSTSKDGQEEDSGKGKDKGKKGKPGGKGVPVDKAPVLTLR